MVLAVGPQIPAQGEPEVVRSAQIAGVHRTSSHNATAEALAVPKHPIIVNRDKFTSDLTMRGFKGERQAKRPEQNQIMSDGKV